MVAKEAKQSLGEVAAQTKEQAAELAEQVKQQAGEKIDAQKSQAAERLGGVASALRETGRTLHEQEDDTVAQYVDSLAGQVEKASTYLKEMNISDMAREIQNFAQRKPEMFLLTSLAAGFLLGRFLRSSPNTATSPAYAGSNGGSYPSAYHAGSSETSQRAYTPDPASVYSVSE
jgi:phage-related protein